MIWTCDNCGRKMEVSRDQLEETGGVVVCPQCLGTGRVPMGQRRSSSVDGEGPVIRGAKRQQAIAFESADDVPPQHRRRGTQSRSGDSGQQRPPARKKSGSSRPGGSHMSALGCAWRSLVIVAAFILVYQLLGFLMSL